MNFFDRLSNGWTLLKSSFSVIRANPTLLLFPVSTGVLTLVIAGLFMTPIVLQPSSHGYMEKEHWAEVGARLVVKGPPTLRDQLKGRTESYSLSPQALAYGVLFYFLSMFLATFFNVAFTHEIFDALDGNPVSVREGIQFALTKLKPILMWTLFAGLVGILIKSLEEKFGLFGRMVIRSIGLAWSVASVFVIPVLVLEEHPDNPIGVVRQSAGVIRKAWGEAIAGYAGLQVGGFIVVAAMFVVLGFGGWVSYSSQSAWPFVGSIGVWLLFAVVFSYGLGVAGQVYLCVLYRYATKGTVPAGFTSEMLGLAWTPKKA